MQEIHLDHWSDFERALEELERSRNQRRERVGTYVSELLFRGQSDSSWPLRTTLERATGEETSLRRYLQVICSLKPEIESYTGRTWEFLELGLGKLIEEVEQSLPIPQPLVVYEYMAYLRHHGFPSPLLDWTASPFVAAHFAFAPRGAEHVAIYAYMEDTGSGKEGSVSESQIYSLGPTIRAHTRHFLQRSQYTFCCRQAENERSVYSFHEDAFQRDDPEQDLLWKFVISASERKSVLTHLDRYNISSFSLFGSEESLMESLATREFIIRR